MAKKKDDESNQQVQVISEDELEQLVKTHSQNISGQKIRKEEAIPSEDPLRVVDKIIEPPKMDNHPYMDYVIPFLSTTNLPQEFIELHIYRIKLSYSIMADLDDMNDKINASQEHLQLLSETMARRSGGFEFYKMLFTRISQVKTEIAPSNPVDDVIRKV